MLSFKIILINRLRDFFAIISCSFILRGSLFIILRTLIRPFCINENFISNLIPIGISRLYSYIFFTRARTLDFVFISKFYEPETTNYILNNFFDKVFIFGGHIGRYALLASSQANIVKVLEPDNDNFRILRANVFLNNIKNIEILNKAIGTENCTVEMISDPNCFNNTGKKFPVKSVDKSISVEQITVDQIFSLEMKGKNLVLIDIEGMEDGLISYNYELFKGKILIIESQNPNFLKKIMIDHTFSSSLDAVNHLFLPL